mmetsp:Transcript_69153/g.150482  ORF Transcript_69153/g.150482 Transcript_69153/m.150482 type:complete len:82 (-) Transcript_69153:261-506(-)
MQAESPLLILDGGEARALRLLALARIGRVRNAPGSQEHSHIHSRQQRARLNLQLLYLGWRDSSTSGMMKRVNSVRQTRVLR